MNFRLITLFIVLSVFISAFSCSNKSKQSRKPTVQIKIESANKKIITGDDIHLSFSVKVKDGQLKETRIFIDTTLITSSTDAEFSYTLKQYKTLGKQTVKAVAIKTDGVEGTYFKNLEVYSDISPERMGYEVVRQLPHNDSFFTEGLELHNGFLYESTGEHGTSAIYKTNLTTGKVLSTTKLADRYFGEGITIFNNRVYQLTYKSKIGFIYDLETMALTDSFQFASNEGWGMTHDEKHLIMSDGTNVLTYLDPQTLRPVKKLQVYDNKEAVFFLNELEYHDGSIYANVWNTFLIVKIDPSTGKVLQRISMDGILEMMTIRNKPVDVLNGIAIDPASGKMYVTGKYYPKLFEIKPVKKE